VNRELQPTRLGDFAAAFAFAGILAPAAHVPLFATPLPFATVEPFAIVLAGGGVSGLRACAAVTGFAAGAHRSDNQSGHRGRDDHCSGGSCHIFDCLNGLSFPDWPSNGRFKRQIPATPVQPRMSVQKSDKSLYVLLVKRQG
jgi:hypothetical protein